MQERFDALCERLATSYDGVPEDVAVAEIEKATALARRESAAAWRAAGRLPALPAEVNTKPARKSTRPAPKPKSKSPAPR
jgi:hypothetical protein